MTMQTDLCAEIDISSKAAETSRHFDASDTNAIVRRLEANVETLCHFLDQLGANVCRELMNRWKAAHPGEDLAVRIKLEPYHSEEVERIAHKYSKGHSNSKRSNKAWALRLNASGHDGMDSLFGQVIMNPGQIALLIEELPEES